MQWCVFVAYRCQKGFWQYRQVYLLFFLLFWTCCWLVGDSCFTSLWVANHWTMSISECIPGSQLLLLVWSWNGSNSSKFHCEGRSCQVPRFYTVVLTWMQWCSRVMTESELIWQVADMPRTLTCFVGSIWHQRRSYWERSGM